MSFPFVRTRAIRYTRRRGEYAPTRTSRQRCRVAAATRLTEAEMNANDTNRTVAVLNRLLEAELAGVVRYTHYSFLVFGFGRIPLVSWLRDQANESLMHSQQAGEWITTLGAYPSLVIGPLLDSHKHDTGVILRESLEAEGDAFILYRELLALVKD